MDQRIIDLYDEYTHAPLDRRDFIARLAEMTGSLSAALALVPLLEAGGRPAAAAIVPADDARLEVARVEVTGPRGAIRTYVAHPKGAKALPAVVVIHENRGLNAHIEDVTRRLALEGFLAAAPDLLSTAGGTPENPDSARALIGRLNGPETLADLTAVLRHLKSRAPGNRRVGAVGFCWGGGMVGELLVSAPELDAGVVYYGRQPSPALVPKIKAPLLLHYAGLDGRINEGIPAFETALQAAKVNYTLYRYEGVNHAFNNDTSEARYNREAATLAWGRTVSFLLRSLKA